ncbi:MAG: ABC transporter ATP-binding protein [Nocardioidaceae bacterium]
MSKSWATSERLERVPGGPAGALLDVRDLHVTFRAQRGLVHAVNGLSFSVAPGEVLGIVGESGSGKSVAMNSVMGLLGRQNVEVSGTANFRDVDLLSLDDRRLRSIRGKEIAMIFQDPMTALTPVYTVGWQIVEQLRAHQHISRRAASKRAVELLDEVGIPDPAHRVDNFPHEFSGGMRQRAMIAMALSCDPSLLIADEPTTALDVTTQAQVLDLLRQLRDTHGSSIVLITHDMGVISEIADRVVVMYAGQAMEVGPRRSVIRSPRHPYTWGLLGAIPRPSTRGKMLATIPGAPVSPMNLPPGCPFAPRCRYRLDECDEQPPLLGAEHLDACWLPRADRRELRETIYTGEDATPDKIGDPGPGDEPSEDGPRRERA